MKNLLLLIFFTVFSVQAQTPIKEIFIFEIDSSINPATLNYLKTGFKKITPNDLALIKMNTPGGLVSTTKEIITLFGQANFPIAIWITPEGASATSAGAIISSAAHYLFMSPGANIGAATPIGIGKDIKEKDARNKAINDLVALVSSLSESRGRNAKAFKEMITKAESFTFEQALKKNIIDHNANKLEDILNYIEKNPTNVLGTEQSFSFPAPQVNNVEMDLGQKLLNVFANPNLAYLLFLMGAALLYFEFQAPGGFIAGAIGVVALILAAISFQVLPLNLGALGLIIASFILLILEIYITSYGILTVAGLIALIAGSLFLFRGDDSYLAVSQSLILSAVLAVVSFMALIVYMIIRDRKKIGATDFFNFHNENCSVVKSLGSEGSFYLYRIKVAGEYWNAISEEELAINSPAIITSHDEHHLRLIITNTKESSNG